MSASAQDSLKVKKGLFRNGGSVSFFWDPFFIEDIEHLPGSSAINFFRFNSPEHFSKEEWKSGYDNQWPGSAFTLAIGWKNRPWQKKDGFTESAVIASCLLTKSFEYYNSEYIRHTNDSFYYRDVSLNARYDEIMLGFRQSYFGRELLWLRVILGWQVSTSATVNSRGSMTTKYFAYGKAAPQPDYSTDVRLKQGYSLNGAAMLGLSLRPVWNFSAMMFMQPGLGMVRFKDNPAFLKTSFSINFGLRYDW